jgi:formylmethanofuran dehydrogenase subunit E
LGFIKTFKFKNLRGTIKKNVSLRRVTMANTASAQLEEQLKDLEASGIDPRLMNITRKAVSFHGHLCPGLAMGCVASHIFLDHASPSEDEEVVAVVENDACGVDAIQAITGCSFGKGNLVFLDHGKTVYTFFLREKGLGLRLSLKSGSFEKGRDPSQEELFGKLRAGTATQEETAAFKKGQLNRTKDFLLRGAVMFELTETKEKPPQKARIFDSHPCDSCGEPTMVTRLKNYEDTRLCIPCWKKIHTVQEDGE